MSDKKTDATETVVNADDFMAGFNSDGDTTETATATPVPDKVNEVPGAGATDDTSGRPAGDTTTTQGVDNPQNGGEPSQQQAPALDLSALPDDVRQIVEAQQSEAAQLRETLAQRERDFAALHGKLAPTQRQLADLQNRMQQQPPAAAATASTTSSEASDALAEAEAHFNSPEFLEYAKTWPEEAKLQKESQLRILRTALNQTEQLKRMISTEIAPQLRELQTDRHQNQHREAISALEKEHPDWKKLDQSDEFWDWFAGEEPFLNFQNEAHRQQYLSNQTNVARLLTRFKKDTGYTGEQQQTTAADPVPATTTAARGSARLDMASSPDVRGGAGPARVGAAGVSPGDAFQAGYNSTD